MRRLFKIDKSLIILGLGILAGYLLVARAASPADITFPVRELSGCANETECRAFCDLPENIKPCVAFAEKHNLISAEEAARAKKFAQIGTGPGDCRTQKECDAYCDDTNNINECLDFAEKNSFLSQEELKEAKLVAKALAGGAKLPGNCRNKKDCDNYCDDPTHMEECLNFAEAAGFIPPDELREARMAAKAMTSGIKPPGNCRGKKQCDAYCGEPAHMEECLNFAEAAGFIPKEEVEQARKIMPLMIAGQMPGGCKSKEQCEAYCSDETHLEECANFAMKAGLMKPEEIEIFKKTGGKGPGGCRSKESCDNFCNNQANQETCFKFAEEHDLIPPEKIEEMKQGLKMMQEGLRMAPPETLECLKSNLGTEILEKIRAGTLTPGPQIGDQIRNCFEKFMPAGPPGSMGPAGKMTPSTGSSPPSGFSGPGGCSNKEACQEYCSIPEHLPECSQFISPGAGPSGFPPPNNPPYPPSENNLPAGFQGPSDLPGGCRNLEECTRYCADLSHLEECVKFLPGGTIPANQLPPINPEGQMTPQGELPGGLLPETNATSIGGALWPIFGLILSLVSGGF